MPLSLRPDNVDGQPKAIQQYADNYDQLKGADAAPFVNALLERCARMQALRVKRLTKFQSAVPTGTAARAIQPDPRLGGGGRLRRVEAGNYCARRPCFAISLAVASATSLTRLSTFCGFVVRLVAAHNSFPVFSE